MSDIPRSKPNFLPGSPDTQLYVKKLAEQVDKRKIRSTTEEKVEETISSLLACRDVGEFQINRNDWGTHIDALDAVLERHKGSVFSPVKRNAYRINDKVPPTFVTDASEPTFRFRVEGPSVRFCNPQSVFSAKAIKLINGMKVAHCEIIGVATYIESVLIDRRLPHRWHTAGDLPHEPDDFSRLIARSYIDHMQRKFQRFGFLGILAYDQPDPDRIQLTVSVPALRNLQAQLLEYGRDWFRSHEFPIAHFPVRIAHRDRDEVLQGHAYQQTLEALSGQ